MDRHYYNQHSLTIARHPSETDERMMVRILAFACHANEMLEFGRGISQEDEPALWQKDLTNAVKLWIDVGLPSEKLIRRASAQAEKVVLYTYGGKSADIWNKENNSKLEKLRNLAVFNIPLPASQAMAAWAQRSMDLQCTIQDGQIWFSNTEETISIEMELFKAQDL